MATKDVASEDVRDTLHAAEDLGKELVDALVEKRLACDSENFSFYNAIKKNESGTFHTMYLTPSASTRKEKTRRNL